MFIHSFAYNFLSILDRQYLALNVSSLNLSYQYKVKEWQFRQQASKTPRILTHFSKPKSYLLSWNLDMHECQWGKLR